MNINAIKSFNADKALELIEVMAIAADTRNLIEEHQEHSINVPEWLLQAYDSMQQEIENRDRANKLDRMRKLEASIEGYKSDREKRTAAETEYAELQRQLGLTKSTATAKKVGR